MDDLPIIRKTYDLIQWYVPILNRLPRLHKYGLGDRMVAGLYDLLEELIRARYERERLERLEGINARLDILRYQGRMLFDFGLVAANRYEFASEAINSIGADLGGWIKQQRRRQ